MRPPSFAIATCCYNLPFDRPVTSVARRFTFLFQIEPFMVFASLMDSWSKASTFDNLNSNPMSGGANNRRIYSRSLIYAGGWGSKLPYTNKGNSRWQFLLLLPWLVVAKWVLDFEVCILCWFLMQPCECSEKWNAIALPSISSNPFIAVESRHDHNQRRCHFSRQRCPCLSKQVTQNVCLIQLGHTRL